MKKILTLIFVIGSITFSVAQNVGINTENATRAKIEITGAVPGGATSAIFGTDGAGISFQRNWPTIGFNQYRDVTLPGSQGKYMANGFAAIQYFDPNSGTLAIDMFPSGTANTSTPGGSRALTILANGNWGVRTGTANATLTVARGDGIDGTAVFAGSTHWSHFNYSSGEHTYIRGGVDNSNVYINKIPSGDVYVGNGNSRIIINNPPLTPSYTIDLLQPTNVNSLSLLDAFGYSWHQRLSFTNISGQGSGIILVFYYGGTAKGRFRYYDGMYQPYSDRRLKKNIESLPPVLSKIKQLNPVRYEMKRENQNQAKTIGFVAQEVKAVFPGSVRELTDKPRKGESLGKINTINYSSFSVIAIKALQEQWQEIVGLEKENRELMSKLEQLEMRVQNKL